MLRCEIARLFGVLPAVLLRLPLSEFRVMYRYYLKQRPGTESSSGSFEPTDGTILE